MSWRPSLAPLLVFTVLTLPGPLARAQEPAEDVEDASVQKIIEEYCTAVSDQASEQRAAKQALALKALEARVEQRLTELEQHKVELEELLERREALRNLAEKELVDIYAGMDTEAAAAQMEKIDLALASSVLRQLKPRQASAILKEMKPELAARMVRVIAIAAAPAKAAE